MTVPGAADTAIARSRLLDVLAVAVSPDGTGLSAAGPLAAVGVPVVQSDDGPLPAPGTPDTVALDDAHRVDAARAVDGAQARLRGFAGKVGETLALVGAPVVVLVGCGRLEAAGPDTLRRAAASFGRASGTSGTAAFLLPAPLAAAASASEAGAPGAPPPAVLGRAAQAVAEGAVLGAYRFVAHKSDPEATRVERLVVAGVGTAGAALAEGVRRGVTVAGAVCLARDLVNEPPSTMTPSRLASSAEEHVGSRPGVTVEVWDERRISDERLGGLLGVARGSAEPPRLLRACYEPADPVEVGGRVPHVVLVGKGITFDSGGLSLKSADGMVTMKTDMSGAAAVLATVSACGDLGVRVRVTAIAPVTENMPGSRAIKPGDVLTIRNGRTIEVLNTDAEGRLVLADGLSLASELEPDAVVDLATLTGACVVALGTGIAGVFGSDDALVGKVRAASERAGEPTWPLPLPEDYRSHIDSEVADMKNVGKSGQAGAIAAALLLARFVEGVPWVHLDIAGPARAEEDSGVLVRGGTGYGVRTLLELLEGWAPVA
ncbi:MAG TPA: leucyl aminopeptidase [Acidimicrobiales bacterium]|nr:leucyl aminopeptidase [Acidimicrobiales bacterium]